MLYTRTTNCCGCLKCVFVCWLCFGFPVLSFRSWPYSLRFLLRTRYVVFVFFFVLSVSISSGSGTTPLFLLFILFERSEFLIDTSQKKSLRVCTRVRLLLVLVCRIMYHTRTYLISARLPRYVHPTLRTSVTLVVCIEKIKGCRV